MLESVNFLVSSGRCFVVLAMDRERVEACVAMKLKEIAESLKREPAQYAHDYLDKLVQIEIPIPPMSSTEAQNIASQVRTSSEQRETGAPWWSFQKLMPVSVGLLFAGVLTVSIAGTVAMRNALKSPVTAGTPAAEEFVMGASANTGAPGTPNATRLSDQKSALAPLRVPDLPSVKPGLTKAAEPRIPWGVIAGIPALIAGSGFAVWWIFRTPEELKLTDSETFVSAGKLWAAHIAKLQESPRSLKRFLNRVRYMAMYDSAAGGNPIPVPTLMALSAIAFGDSDFPADANREMAALLEARLNGEEKPDGAASGIRAYRESTNLPWPPPAEIMSRFRSLWKGIRSAPEPPLSSS